jgi:hypothetical protein
MQDVRLLGLYEGRPNVEGHKHTWNVYQTMQCINPEVWACVLSMVLSLSAGVRCLSSTARCTLTWNAVPTYSSFKHSDNRYGLACVSSLIKTAVSKYIFGLSHYDCSVCISGTLPLGYGVTAFLGILRPQSSAFVFVKAF